MPKVLIITGDAAESLEVMYPYQRLLEEGYQVDIAAPSVKKLQFVVHDFTDGFDTYTEKPGYTWPADIAFADVNPADYAALVIPGGRANPRTAWWNTCGSCANTVHQSPGVPVAVPWSTAGSRSGANR
jgi:putative intracellular protease/amidase